MKKKGGLRARWLPPGASSVRGELRALLRAGSEATVTSLAEERLPWISRLMEEDEAVRYQSFGELVARTARLLRIPTRHLAMSPQVLGSLRRICEALPDTNSFHASQRFPGLHDTLARTYQELRHFGVTPLDLRRAATEAGLHGRKLESLADVLDGLETRLAELERTTNTSVIQEVLSAEPTNLAALGQVVLFAGAERHPSAARFLVHVARGGVPVTVFVDGWGSPEAYPEAAAWAEDLGVAIEPPRADPGWLASLFTEGADRSRAPQVQITGMCDRVVECEWAVREAMAAMSEGIPPHQIGFVARELQDYLPLLTFAAQRFGVPLRASVRHPISFNAFVRLLHRLMETVAGHDVRKLAFAIRSTYLAVPRADHQLGFDALFAAHQRAEDPWRALRDWVPFAPDSYKWLGTLLDWREEVRDLRAPLARWVEQWRRLFDLGPLPTTVSSLANPTHERDMRAKNAAETALVAFASAFSAEDAPLTFSEFLALADEIWTEQDVSLPPTHPSGLRVVASPHQLGECKFVVALGMVEGSLPRGRREDPILSDEEREALAQALPDSDPLPTSYQKVQRERDFFLSLCAVAERRLMLTYPLVDEEDEFRAAFYLQELRRLLGAEIETPIRDRRYVVPPVGQARTLGDLQLREALDAPRDEAPVPSIRSESVKDAIRPDWEQGIRLRDLAQALRCPFAAHFGRLGIRNADRRAVWRRLPSLPMRASLAAQPTREDADAALREEQTRFVQEAFPQLDGYEVPLLEATCDRLRAQWLEREFRARQLWPLSAGSIRMKVPMGEEGLPKMLKTGSGKVKIVDEVPVMAEISGTRLLQFYVDRMPSLTKNDQNSNEDSEEPEYSEFLYGLWAYSAARGSGRSALMFDSIRDERVLYLFTDQPSTHLNGEGTRFKRFVRNDPLENWGEKLMADVDRAYAVLDSVLVEPRPGSYCEWCELAELCRSSAEFDQGPEPSEDPA